MKLLPTLLLCVVVAVAAILVYDLVRVEEDAESRHPGPDGALRDAIENIEVRLADLEEAARPLPAAPVVDADLLERLERLERRAATASLEVEPRRAGTPAVDAAEAAPTPKSTGEPSPEEIKNFRKLADAAHRQERTKRSRRQVDAALEELGMVLTEDQREKLVRAYVDFEPRRYEIWTEAKARSRDQGSAVNWETIIAETTAVIEREFTERVSRFIRISDAVAISAILNASGK